MNRIAIVKPIKVRMGRVAGLRAVIDYIKDDSKTQNGDLVFAWNCMKDKEFQQMLITKELFGKTSGRQYAHFVQSFPDNENITPELAHEIGRKYIESLPQFENFQVVMATHTNEPHLHNHIIVNSVNIKTGSKWQFSKADLEFLREQSDALCRAYGLSVIERGNRGHKSYGEYTAYKNGASWKAKLAADIASCLEDSKSMVDFLHRLNEYGIDADFGKKNIMFTIRAGTYGLNKDMMCSNFKLMSYGDFSKQNIEDYFKVNKGILELAFNDIPLVQDAFLKIGKMLFPDNPSHFQDLYFGGMDYIDFDGLTRKEIEAYLKHKKAQQLDLKARMEWDKQSNSGGKLLATIADILELIDSFWRERQLVDLFAPEHENEYEL